MRIQRPTQLSFIPFVSDDSLPNNSTDYPHLSVIVRFQAFAAIAYGARSLWWYGASTCVHNGTNVGDTVAPSVSGLFSSWGSTLLNSQLLEVTANSDFEFAGAVPTTASK